MMKYFFYIIAALFIFIACAEEDEPTFLADPVENVFIDTITPKVSISILNMEFGYFVYSTEDIVIDLKGEANKGLLKMSVQEGETIITENTFLHPYIAEKSFNLGKRELGSYDIIATVEDSTGLSESISFTLEVIEKGLAKMLFHVNFDGGVATDLIGGLVPVANGTPSFGEDREAVANNAYQGAAESYLLYTISDTSWMDQTLSIAFWYKNANPSSGGRAGIVTMWDAASGLNGIATLRRDIGYSSNWGLVSGDTWLGSSSGGTYGGSTIIKDTPYTDEWQHVVYTLDNEDLKMYINGELAVINTLGSALSWNGVTTISIGSGLPNYSRYNYGTTLGRIDDVRIYDVALDVEEIQNLLD